MFRARKSEPFSLSNPQTKMVHTLSFSLNSRNLTTNLGIFIIKCDICSHCCFGSCQIQFLSPSLPLSLLLLPTTLTRFIVLGIANDIIGQVPATPRRDYTTLPAFPTELLTQTPSSPPASSTFGAAGPSSPYFSSPNSSPHDVSGIGNTPLPPVTPQPGSSTLSAVGTFLQLIRLNPNHNFNSLLHLNRGKKDTKPEEEAAASQSLEEDFDFLTHYLSKVNHPSNRAYKEIQLPFLLQYKKLWTKTGGSGKHRSRVPKSHGACELANFSCIVLWLNSL